MKKHLVFLTLLLVNFSINADGIKLTCSPNEPACDNCPEFQTLFAINELSKESGSLEVEADESEIMSNQTYHLKGDVTVKTDELFLSADDVKVSTMTDETLARGNVKFQDSSFLIASDELTTSKDDNGNQIAIATNANFQDFGSGQGGGNGFAEIIEKQPNNVLLTQTTYSTCPVNKSDWLIDASYIDLNLEKNRGVADHAKIRFYDVPIFYLPKYSWVLQGRGSGFLTPDIEKYNEPGRKEDSIRWRVPYYLNLAPDRDLLIALTYMSSRGFIFEETYRQLIAPKLDKTRKDSIFKIETRYLNEDKITKLRRWLIDSSLNLDLSKNSSINARYYRVSDKNYFKEVTRSNTNVNSLPSHLKLNFWFPNQKTSVSLLTEAEQVVNAGSPSYTRALEGSISQNFVIDTNEIERKKLTEEEEISQEWKFPYTTISTNFVSTKFSHDTHTKESGLRTNGLLSISRPLAVKFPVITPSANVNVTKYSLKTSPNINRTIFGSGLGIDFTTTRKTNLFGFEASHRITPKITYNYRAKKVQGNIPIFDTTDKYTDIITFADLTSGERYTGLDRITNANDITLSLESEYTDVDAIPNAKALLNMGIAQSFYTDDEVVSDTINSNYETRLSYSNIVASIGLAINNFTVSSDFQFDPDKSLIVKRANSVSYSPSPRTLASVTYSDDNITRTGQISAVYPLSDYIHVFGGLNRNITKATGKGITTEYTSGLAYENCCWAFRLAHFQADRGQGDNSNNYSTGFELILKGLGTTSTPLKDRIENTIPGYGPNLRK
ncbi:LPS assembly protein LptD [Candidatus Thioglobus sp.]|nr:LPS assembly protein LptD [Candidatus Thioglobus sp.]